MAQRGKNAPEDQRQHAVSLYDEGWVLTDVALATGVAVSTARWWALVDSGREELGTRPHSLRLSDAERWRLREWRKQLARREWFVSHRVDVPSEVEDAIVDLDPGDELPVAVWGSG